MTINVKDKNRGEVTQALVRSLYDYDPATGALVHKVNKQGGRAKKGQVAGYFDAKKRLRVGIFCTHYYASRIIWLWMTGEWPTTYIDHKNSDTTDNSWDNLREATTGENARNRVGHSATGYKGVAKKHVTERYYAAIMMDGKKVSLGYFDTAEEAAKVYDGAALKYFGEFAKLNFTGSLV